MYLRGTVKALSIFTKSGFFCAQEFGKRADVSGRFVHYSHGDLYRLDRPTTSGIPIVKLVTYNVQYGRRKDDHFDDDIGEATWIRPPNYPGDGDKRLDYCFLSPPLVGRVLNAWVDSESQGSDHQPYWVEIDV